MHNLANDELSKTLSAMAADDNVTLNETLSNNVLLDLVISKQTNIKVVTYGLTLYEGKLLHVFGGNDSIFMRNEFMDRKILLQNRYIKRLQCNSIIS